MLNASWLDLLYHELQCLVAAWTLEVLCIYVLRSQKGLARYQFVISCYDYFEKVLSSEIFYYFSLVDYAIDMSKHETYVLLWIWLVYDLWRKLECWLYIFTTTRANRVCKSFSLSLSVYQLNCLRTSKGKLGGVDTSPSYLLFQTLLTLFWTLICMIWMELTRTDAVFSRTAMVLYLCRNKSSRNDLKIHGDNFWEI